jgi:peptide deformylase
LIRPLRFFPDPLLNTPAQAVTRFTHQTQKVIQDLLDTLDASPGVGLAAPQIGVLERIAVVDVSRDRRKTPRSGSNHGLLILVNPEILSAEGVQVPREGCLSVPDLLADVRRPESVRFRSWDEAGNEQIIDVKGFEALAVQHEVDHLNGKLFLDRVSNVKTDLFRRQI